MARHDDKPLTGHTREFRLVCRVGREVVRSFEIDSVAEGEEWIKDDGEFWDSMVIEWRDVPPWKPLPVTGAGA